MDRTANNEAAAGCSDPDRLSDTLTQRVRPWPRRSARHGGSTAGRTRPSPRVGLEKSKLTHYPASRPSSRRPGVSGIGPARPVELPP